MPLPLRSQPNLQQSLTRTGVQTPSNTGGFDTAAGGTDGDLSIMTPAQLQDLAIQVLAELAKRAESK
jgi:hypothetical protein